MSGARQEILQRVEAALGDVGADEGPQDVVVARAYRRQSALSGGELADLLATRLREYGATAELVGAAELPRKIADASATLGLGRLAVASELDDAWRAPGIELVEDRGLAAGELERIEGALTGCAAAIAESGTLVLDGRGPSGRRALSLLCDKHICVVDERQIVGILPQAIARLAPAARSGAPITMISGPSATSDIELTRVEGVHGPRRLHVLIVAATRGRTT